MGRRRRPPKPYTFHSRKARFKVYCTSPGQQEALLQHILQTESQESLRCVIVSPDVSADGQQLASVSARRNRPSPLALLLHRLENLRPSSRRTRTYSGSNGESSDDSDDSDSSDSSSSSSGGEDGNGEDGSSDDGGSSDDSSTSSDDVSSVDAEEDQPAPVNNMDEHKEGDRKGQEGEVYGYRVFLEYHTARAMSSPQWGVAIFEGFDQTQHLEASTPQCTSKYKDEKDNYIADLLIQHHTATLNKPQPAPAVHGTPSLDEHATLRLVSCKYSTREEQDKVIADIRLYCCGRGAAESTYARIKKQWRFAHKIPTTPKAVSHVSVVGEPPRLSHPFFAHKRLDKWVAQFIGTGKPLSRLEYMPLVVWSKSGRIGKTEWAKSLGRHIHIRGSLDPEKIHAGIQQGADVIILDNIKWHLLFGSDLGRALAEGQDSVTWLRANGERVTTKLPVPVVILNNKKCKTWGPNNKKYWKKNLRWVRVRKCLFDTSKTIDTDAPPTASPTPPPSSQPLLTSTLPPPVNAISPPPSSSSGAVPSPIHAPQPSFPSPAAMEAPSISRLPRSSTPVRDRLRRKIAERQLEALQINKTNISHYGPGSYLLTDWLRKGDADGQQAAWEKLASQFKLMKHRGNSLARWKAFYCDPLAGSRTSYEYTSSELEAWQEHEWSPEGLQLRDAVRATIGEDVNSLVANDYRHRKHKITWHSDKPADIQHGTAIATVSLGHARLFQLCPIPEVKRWMDAEKARTKQMKLNRKQGIKKKLPPVDPLADVIDIVLPHGSLFVIGPETNEHYMHCIPPSEEKCGRRYGLTFRTIASRWIPDVEVVIRQPPKGETAWDVVYRPKEPRAGKEFGQNGYAYRSRIHLEPYTPRDPLRLTEEDIIAVRDSMPSRPKRKGKPSRTEDPGSDSETDKAEEGAVDASDEEEDSESGEDEEPEQKRSKRKGTDESTGSRKKQRNAGESGIVGQGRCTTVDHRKKEKSWCRD